MKYLILLFNLILIFACQNEKNIASEKQVVAAHDYDQKLTDLDITLPAVTKPAANFVNIRQAGNILYFGR